MKFVNGIFALAVVIFAASCSTGMNPVDMLNRAQPVGSPYTKHLANGYRDLANSLSGSDAKHFARKGLAAVDGINVAPEMLEDWNLKNADAAELAEARGELISVLENGGRDRAPDNAAIAQTRFDCWAAQAEESGADSCKEQFHAALSAMQSEIAAAPPVVPPAAPASTSSEFPSPVTSGPRGETVPLQQASFLAFFDWNKYTVSESARGVMDTVAQEIKSRHDITRIIVVGHTDTSGGEKYNMKLSLKRADAVRNALVSHGIPAKKIHVEGRGKTDLLVKTPDNVREPQNRRVQITFE